MAIIPGAVVVPANIDDLNITLEGARTLAQLYAYDGTNWDRVRVSAAGLLVDTELAAAAALTDAFATPTTAPVGAFGMVYDRGATDWNFMTEGAVLGSVLTDMADRAGRLVGIVDTELPAAAALTDAFANPTVPGVGAFLMGLDNVAGDWERVQVNPGTGDLQVAIMSSVGLTVDTELPAALALTDAIANPTVPGVGAYLMGYDGGAGTWERVHVTPGTGHLDVAVQSIVAIDTELAAAAALTDNFATPNTAPVGAFSMVYDLGNTNWNMLREGATEGSALVDVVDRAGRLAGIVVTEMSAAAALTDAFANPTAGGVGAFSMGYDGTDWERLRVLQAPNAVGGRAVGNLAVGKTEGKATYRVAFKDLVAVAGVAVRIQGSASEIVRVTRVQFAKPSVAQAPLRMVKCSSAPVDGTSTNPAGIPLDSADDAATAVVDLYTAAPTGGAEIGTGSLFEGDVGIGDVLYEAFGDEQNTQAVVLRGTAETLEIDISAGATINGYLEWTEE